MDRIRWLAPLAGGHLAAFSTLLRIRQDRDAVQTVFYGSTRVNFRGQDTQALREVFVDREYDFLADFLGSVQAPSILDIGAHVGTFGIWAYGLNAKARIVSIEADPQTFQLLSQNAAALIRNGTDWRVVHGAATGENGGAVNLSNAGPSMSHRVDPGGTVKVPGISMEVLLDSIVPDGDAVDLVKIDIEGSEEALLMTAPDMLRRVTSLVIELHPQLCNTIRVRKLLEEHFDHIAEVGGRTSTKPLLYCRHF